ncbi:MAG: alpha/beta hydrolase [Pseudomonadota bacterium]|nr:alpha/beta hydrolase [Pseudomonadota bacterium]
MIVDIFGSAVYCYTGGKAFDASLPCVIFIHGAQHDHSVWALQSRYFAHHGFSVLALDLPGHVRSGGAPLTSIAAMADWLIALMDATGITRALLVGHSMGSLIALETAHRAPQRVSAVALVGTTYPMTVSPALLSAALEREPEAIDMVNIWSHSGIAQKPSSPGPGFSVVGGNRRLMQRVATRCDSKVFHTDFIACNGYDNGAVAAAALTCPCLLLLGEQDQMTPPRAITLLSKAIAHAQVVRLPNCGHALMAEQPDAVLTELLRFARQPISRQDRAA